MFFDFHLLFFPPLYYIYVYFPIQLLIKSSTSSIYYLVNVSLGHIISVGDCLYALMVAAVSCHDVYAQSCSFIARQCYVCLLFAAY